MNKSSGGALSNSDFSMIGNDTPRSRTIGLQRISEALIVSLNSTHQVLGANA
jgi:hypothetical protein